MLTRPVLVIFVMKRTSMAMDILTLATITSFETTLMTTKFQMSRLVSSRLKILPKRQNKVFLLCRKNSGSLYLRRSKRSFVITATQLEMTVRNDAMAHQTTVAITCNEAPTSINSLSKKAMIQIQPGGRSYDTAISRQSESTGDALKLQRQVNKHGQTRGQW